MSDLEMQVILVEVNSLKLANKTSELKELLGKRAEYVNSVGKDKEKDSWFGISSPYDDEIQRVTREIKRLGYTLRKESLAFEKKTKAYKWFAV